MLDFVSDGFNFAYVYTTKEVADSEEARWQGKVCVSANPVWENIRTFMHS